MFDGQNISPNDGSWRRIELKPYRDTHRGSASHCRKCELGLA